MDEQINNPQENIEEQNSSEPQAPLAETPEIETGNDSVEVKPVKAGVKKAKEQKPEDVEEDLEIPQNAAPDNPLRVLEALLFAADELLTTDRIKTIVPGQPDARKIRQMVDKLNVQFSKERHPFEIVEIGGGYQFRTISYYYPWVVQLFKEKSAKKLSIQSLECLAIIAYKQPITKAEIEQVRGVLSDGAMKTLLEKRLVAISGRSDKAGRPLLYSTSKEFLAYFGINKIADLPRIEEFEVMAKEKLGELTETELQVIEHEKTVAMPENAGENADGSAAEAATTETETPQSNDAPQAIADTSEQVASEETPQDQ